MSPANAIFQGLSAGGHGKFFRPRRLRTLRAFSLVELMVVIGIIGLLAALAFPAFNSAVQTSRLYKCASNMRQLGVGIQLYMAENDGFLPMSAIVAGDPETSWQELIAPYVLNQQGGTKGKRFILRKQYRCPGDHAAIGDGVVYGANNYLNPTIYNKPVKKLTVLNQRHSDFMLLGENYTADLWNATPAIPWNTGGRLDFTRHVSKGDVANFLFADFHVEALNYQGTQNRPMIFMP